MFLLVVKKGRGGASGSGNRQGEVQKSQNLIFKKEIKKSCF